jgi:hypothetical protein
MVVQRFLPRCQCLSRGRPAQDINAMARWTSLKVVHYRVVGEFSGPIDEGGISARVIDSVDIEFDWDQIETGW